MPTSFRQKLNSFKKPLSIGKLSLLTIGILLLLSGSFYLAQPMPNSPTPEKITEQPQQEISMAIPKDTPDTEQLKQEISTTPKNMPDNDFSFAILGDTQRFEAKSVDGGLQQAVASLKNKPISFLVAVGDLLSSCDGEKKCETNLTEWKDALGPLFAHTYAVMGNHDRTGKEKADALWQRFFNFPKNGPTDSQGLVYSFDFNNSHFVFLNSEKPKEHHIDQTQRDWLEADLAKNSQLHTFVFFHEPAYPTKSKIDSSLDSAKDDRNALWQILERYHVDAVFSGHEHIQNHKKIGTVDQFIFGNTDSFDHELPAPNPDEFSYAGKGFGLVSVSTKGVQVEFFTTNGKLLQTISLAK
ncbi:MAG: metallophosphoesterase [Parcubacteria group bacterium]|jgi:predicted phosphodiesterase